MAARSILEEYVQVQPVQTSTQQGVIIFTAGSFNQQVNYTLNQAGSSYTLTVQGPCMDFINLPIPSLTGGLDFNIPTTAKTVIETTVSTGSTTQLMIGTVLAYSNTIQIFASMNNTPFAADPTNPQGFQFGFTINYTI